MVLPGESIQRAVDAAAPGDTVLVLPGTYRESVRITVPGLTLRGTGALTVITPATPPPAATTPTTTPPTSTAPDTTTSATTTSATTTPAADTPTTAPTAAATPTDAASDACALAGNGICVTGTPGHRLTGVTVESLTVTGFAKYGVSGTETDGLTVRDVRADANGLYGIGAEKSVRTGFTGNRADRNGEAGIFLANTTEGEAGRHRHRGRPDQPQRGLRQPDRGRRTAGPESDRGGQHDVGQLRRPLPRRRRERPQGRRP